MTEQTLQGKVKREAYMGQGYESLYVGHEFFARLDCNGACWLDQFDGQTIRLTVEVIPEPLDTPEPTVEVKLGWLNESGHFDEYCDKYGMNPYAMNEGLADRDETVKIAVSDFQRWFKGRTDWS